MTKWIGNNEWSRRARGFATYAAIREMGCRGVSVLIKRCCDHAKTLVTDIAGLPGVEMVCEPMLNQGSVRFPSSRPDATGAEHDANTDRVIARILETGEAFLLEQPGRAGVRCESAFADGRLPALT